MSRMDRRLSTGQWYVHARVCSIVILLFCLRHYLLKAKKQLNLLVNVDIMIYEPSALNNFALVNMISTISA